MSEAAAQSDRLKRDLERTTERIRIARGIAREIVEGRRMSKLSAISQRIVEKKAAHDAKADEWAKRLDAIDRIEPQAFAIGDAVVAEREADVKGMERDMRQLSNLPSMASDGSGAGSEKAKSEVIKSER